MCRKLAYLTVGVIAVMLVLSFTTVGSYVRTYCCSWQKTIAGAVPIEVEIQRLRHEVDRLTPDLKKNMTIVANEKAAIERMEKEIAQARSNLDKHKANLLKVTTDLDSGTTEFIYQGSTYNRNQVIQKLSRDFEQYKRAEAELQTRQKELDTRRQKLDVARSQLTEMKNQEEQLRLQIDRLETELQLVRLHQVKNNVNVDDSRLSHVRQSIADLQERINAEKILTDMHEEFFPNPNQVTTAEPTAPRPVNDLIREVRQHLTTDAQP